MTASSAAAAAVIWRPGDALELAALRAPFWDACMQLKLQVVRRPFCSDQSDQRPSRRPCMAAHLSPRCEADGRQGYRSQLQAALHGTSWQPRLRQAPSACRTRVVRHLHRPSNISHVCQYWPVLMPHKDCQDLVVGMHTHRSANLAMLNTMCNIPLENPCTFIPMDLPRSGHQQWTDVVQTSSPSAARPRSGFVLQDSQSVSS